MRGVEWQVGRVGQSACGPYQFGVQALGELVGLLCALPVAAVFLPEFFDYFTRKRVVVIVVALVLGGVRYVSGVLGVGGGVQLGRGVDFCCVGGVFDCHRVFAFLVAGTGVHRHPVCRCMGLLVG